MAQFLQVCAPLLSVATALTLQRGVEVPPSSAAEQIEAVRLRLRAAPEDLEAQSEGCEALRALADTQRDPPLPSGERRVSTDLLSFGIGEVLSQGVLNAVTIEAAQGLTAPGTASSSCFWGLAELHVQNDYDKGLAFISNAPHFWKAVMTFYRAFQGSDLVNEGLCIFAGFFGTPQPSQATALEVEAGAIDFVLEYLQNESLKSDPEMFQRVFCALSDPVHEPSGAVARAIANYGGPLQGIPLMVRSLRWAKESGSTFHESNGFGLLYEAVHDVGGILEHDDANHSFATAFLQAGLVEELVPIMREEPADRQLQDMSCEAIKWITDDNYAVQTQLVEMGALELIAEALKRHSHPPNTGYCAVTIACSTALLNFASNNQMWRERLIRLGVYETLNEEVFAAFPMEARTDYIGRVEWFPNSNIYKLKDVLEPFA